MQRWFRPTCCVVAVLGSTLALPCRGQSAVGPLGDPAQSLLAYLDSSVALPNAELRLRAVLPTSTANDKAAQLSYLGLRLQDARHLQRYGRGWTRYSADGMDASWFRFGSDVGFALQHHALDLPGGIDIDTGLAALRMAPAGNATTAGTQRVYLPSVSVGFRNTLHMNLMLAPPLGGRPAVAFGALAFSF